MTVRSSTIAGQPLERIEMADLADWSTDHRIVNIAHDARSVTVNWEDNVSRRFPALWLRDNCACPDCRHPRARERHFLFVNAPRQIAVATANLMPGGHLEVRFASLPGEGPHLSRFDAGWLRRHSASEAGDPVGARRRRLWDAELTARLPTVEYDAVMHSDAGLTRWLEAMLDYGIVLLRGAPPRPGEILLLASLIQPHSRPTNFGAVYNVVSLPDPNASADTPMALEPHTDLANWQDPPQVQLLFCVTNEAEGGGSILVDGCRVAEELRQVDPEGFRLLTTHPVEFRFHDADCDIRYRGLSIETDRDGAVVAVRFNNWLRTAFDLPEDLVEPMYEALQRFWTLLREPRFQVVVKLDAGDLLALNNRQVLHGREAFNPNTGRRHLQGCYVDLDMVRSRLRVLARRAQRGKPR